METQVIMIGIAAYLLGSLPIAVLVSRGFHGKDIREHGSGNAGATNVFRVLGKRTGTAVLLLDILKGFTACNLVYLSTSPIIFENLIPAKIVLGLLAVIGHLYPVFAGFKGGKGIATLLGMVFALHYLLALACIGVFLVVLLSTQMVSLASITAALSFSFFVFLIFGFEEVELLEFGFVAAALVLFTHRSNLKRIWNGTENKVNI